MIEAKCYHGDISINANGDLLTLCADTASIIASIYMQIIQANPEHAKFFKTSIKNGINLAFDMVDADEEEGGEEGDVFPKLFED